MTVPLSSGLVDRLHERSGATRWGLAREHFETSLQASVSHNFRGRTPGEADIEKYLNALHLEDLALAAACAAGHEAAWDYFIKEHRPLLYRAADAIDPSGGARDLADALYGELFGLTERDGTRRSHFEYFHGRSSLATWLRAVLAQRSVDRARAARRFEPLPDDDAAGAPTPLESPRSVEHGRFVLLLRTALAAALGRLAPRDRLRLACYYARELTLAQIGRTLGEHEATVSRQLAKGRKTVRADVERQLREAGLNEAAIAECFAAVSADPGPLDLTDLLEPAGGKNPETGRST